MNGECVMAQGLPLWCVDVHGMPARLALTCCACYVPALQRALLRTAQEIAKGMEYIHDFDIVHGGRS